ncbi:MAG: PilZ domain-containing protein [Proteobacteria bacterium]|nr:PilZ domain-containing protein [Pseudomonadota bacterium]
MTNKKSGPEETAHWELKDLPVAPDGATPTAADLEKIIRKNYREPIADDDPVCAEIDGLTHRVCDIGSRGLGLILSSPGAFQAGSSCSITLHIGNNTITLRGKTTHISPIETSGEYHCGIEFINLGQNEEQTLQHFLTAHHIRLFGKTSDAADRGRD